MAPSHLRLHFYLARYLSKKHLYPRIRSPSTFYLSSTSQINGHLPHQFARHVVQTPWSHFFSCFSSPTQCRYVSTTTSPIGEILETISKGVRFDEERNGVVKSLDLFTSNDVGELPEFSSEVSFATARKETNLGLKDDDFAESCRVVTTRDPAELYRELRGNSVVMRREDFDGWGSFREVMDYFVRSGWASDQALAVYIPRSFFPTAASKFLSFLKAHATLDVQKCIVFLGPSRASDRFLFPLFAEFCIEEFSDEIKKYRLLVESADLTMPHTWFPFARAMKRKIIYHCGPTNSGKTYNALQRFMEAKKGVYCSPLRLLAMEVFDKVNSLGVYCSLLTGQEKKLLPFSNHTACTIEMVSTDELYDVAIIDEIQMAADLTRGHAWTRALLGLKADEIHLCGDPSVLKLVRKICKGVGDELVEHHYKRFKPLVVEAKTMLGDLRNVRPGDCIVAFSRREIFEVKLAIEKFTKHRCCVIYGALPPETRRQQANLFNEEDNEYDVLVASDAVGMGLNLNIRRIVFYTLSKYNGDKIVPVPASQVKQIAGRAGRRGCRYPDGLVTTLQSSDLDYLIECLKEPFEEIKQVGLFPFFEQVELFAGQYSDISFPQLLDKFRENCRLDGNYFLCHLHHVRKVAQMLEKVPGLSLQDRFNFCFAPVNIRDPKAMYHLLRFASRFSEKRPVSLALGLPKGSARNDSELLDLECKHQVLSMYLWLSQQFDEDKFPFKNKVEQMVTDIVSLLNESLLNACWKPESRYQSGRQKTEEEKTYQEDNLEEDIHDELSYSRNGLPRTKSIIKPSQKDKMHSFLKAST